MQFLQPGGLAVGKICRARPAQIAGPLLRAQPLHRIPRGSGEPAPPLAAVRQGWTPTFVGDADFNSFESLRA